MFGDRPTPTPTPLSKGLDDRALPPPHLSQGLDPALTKSTYKFSTLIYKLELGVIADIEFLKKLRKRLGVRVRLEVVLVLVLVVDANIL